MSPEFVANKQRKKSVDFYEDVKTSEGSILKRMPLFNQY